MEWIFQKKLVLSFDFFKCVLLYYLVRFVWTFVWKALSLIQSFGGFRFFVMNIESIIIRISKISKFLITIFDLREILYRLLIWISVIPLYYVVSRLFSIKHLLVRKSFGHEIVYFINEIVAFFIYKWDSVLSRIRKIVIVFFILKRGISELIFFGPLKMCIINLIVHYNKKKN